MRTARTRKNSGKINLLVMIGLIAIGGVVAYLYVTNKKEADRTLDKAGKAVGTAVDKAGKDLEKSKAETEAELEQRNANIQAKRGFNITK